MVMDSRPPPPRPKSVQPAVNLVNYWLMKRTEPGDQPFYAIAQEHFDNNGRKFWQGVAIDTASNRRRRFNSEKDALAEAEVFRGYGIRVDGIIQVSLHGQRLMCWTHPEQAPDGPDSGTW